MIRLRTKLLVVLAFLLSHPFVTADQQKPLRTPAPPARPASTPGPATTADGWKLIADGRYGEAEKLARDLLARTEAQKGANSVETAKVLDVLSDALWRSGKTKDSEALDLIKRAVEIKEKALGAEHLDVADSLMILGSILQRRGLYAEAQPVLERTLAILRGSLGESDIRVGKAEHNIGSFFNRTGDLEKAESHLKNALRIFEKAEGPESVRAADTTESLANLAADRGRLEEAEGLYERSLRVREKLLGPRHPNVGNSYNNIGYLHWEMGEYEKSRTELETAVRIREEVLGEGHQLTIMSLANLAITQGYLGLDSEATWERLVRLADLSVGPQHPLAAGLRSNYAVAVEDWDPVTALRLREEALAVLRKTYGPEHPEVLWTLTGLGNTALKLGDVETACRYHEEAVRGFEKHAGEHTDLATGSLRALGECRIAENRPAEARALFEKALVMAEKVYGPEHDDVAVVLMHKAGFLRQTGDFERARSAYTRALSIREKKLGVAHLRTAGTSLALAELEAEAGDLKKARGLFEGSVMVFEKTRGPEHPQTAEAHQKHAECLLKAGEALQALEEALRAEAGMRPNLRLTLSGLPERQALNFAEKAASGLDVAISAALLDGKVRSTAPALDALIRSRALVLDEMARRHQTVWAGRDPGAKPLLETYVAARQRLANLTVRGPDEKYPEKFRIRLDKAKRDKEAAERVLAAGSLEFRRNQQLAGAGLAEVSAALTPGASLVAFARLSRPAAAPARTQKPGQHVDTYIAFVLSAGKRDPVLVALGPARDIDAEVLALRKSITETTIPRESLAKAAEASYRRAGAALRHQIWDPVERHLSGVTTVFIVPDGALQFVSFAALPVGNSSYLVEKGPKIHYLSAERDLLSDDVQRGVGLMAAGGPDFDTPALLTVMRPAPVSMTQLARPIFRGERSKCASFESLHFEPLPSALREVEEVGVAWRARTGAADGRAEGKTGDPILLTGPAANELAVKTNVPGKSVLHLATHGYFLETCPAKGVAKSGEGQIARVLTENPLLRSGLALAGANRRAESLPDVDDGILTAEEIGALDLSGVEWAVLSGCDTGRGEIRTGEGVLGLRRAFQVAGVRTLILSLWGVEDESSRMWMRTLYRNRFEKRMTTVDAVHEASLEGLRELRASGKSTHPVFWAGFVAAGDWK